jgi:hypothetical protein
MPEVGAPLSRFGGFGDLLLLGLGLGSFLSNGLRHGVPDTASYCCSLVGFADLLYKDYHTDQKFTFTTYATNGTVSIRCASSS